MRRLLPLMLAGLLCGCESIPFLRPETPVPATWRAQAETTDSLANRPWRDVFPIPELSGMVDEALAANSDLRIAVERVELARAQYGIERAALYPSVNMAGNATRQRAPGADPSQNLISESAAFSLAIPAWEIDLWGRLRAQSKAAYFDLQASLAQVQAVRISLAAQVATLYLDLLDLDNQIAISTRTLEARRRGARLNQARFDEGIASIIDVHEAKSLLASAEQTLTDQRRRLALTENSLSVLLGRNPGAIERTARLDNLGLPASALAGLPSELLQRRPDILAAEEALRSADANIEAARKAFLPSLSLSTMLGFASPAIGQLFNGGRFAWSVQPALGLSIFDGGRMQFGVEIAEAQQRILVEQYKNTIRQAFKDVNDALVSIEQLRAQQVAGNTIVLANRGRLQAVNARYLTGVTGYFEVLDAERQLLDSELSLSQTKRSVHQSVVQLYRALGGGWQRPAEADRSS